MARIDKIPDMGTLLYKSYSTKTKYRVTINDCPFLPGIPGGFNLHLILVKSRILMPFQEVSDFHQSSYISHNNWSEEGQTNWEAQWLMTHNNRIDFQSDETTWEQTIYNYWVQSFLQCNDAPWPQICWILGQPDGLFSSCLDRTEKKQNWMRVLLLILTDCITFHQDLKS